MRGIFKSPISPDNSGAIEWLETNNAGAYSSSTISEEAQRKYHGLLVTPIDNHEGRFNILSAINESSLDGLIKMGTNKYIDSRCPESWDKIDNVKLLPWPAWNYTFDNIQLKKKYL